MLEYFDPAEIFLDPLTSAARFSGIPYEPWGFVLGKREGLFWSALLN